MLSPLQFPQGHGATSQPSTPQQQQQAPPHTPSSSGSASSSSSASSSLQLAPRLSPEIVNNPAACHRLLDEVYQWKQKQKDQLDKVRAYQKGVMQRPTKEGYELLVQQHQQMKMQIAEELKTLQSLFQQVILPPSEIHKLIYLLQDLKLQQIQVELYQQELQRLTLPPSHPSLARPVCALVIVEQPLPMVITKNKQLEDDPVVIQLLTGSNVDIQSFSKVKVAMICENQQAKPNTAKAIENDTQTMDAFRHIAKFYLKFLSGSRKNPVRLRFGIQLQVNHQGAPQTVTVESNSSRPFIVITNEIQWEESEGILLKKDAFGEQLEVTWPQFANVLQRHFLRATRQDLIKPTRQLSLYDFQYINHNFFGGQPIVSQKGYDAFWEWFGKAVHKLRYQRHICPLWQTGLIYGFLTREGVRDALINEEVGTFLIRMSERHPGLFAVGYKTDDPDIENSVRHYLVRPEDTAGAKKTLPDFLCTCPAFQYLLQVTIDPETEKPKLRRFAKDVALQPYYSKKSSITDAKGYDDEPTLPGNLLSSFE